MAFPFTAVFFEEEALSFPLGQELYRLFSRPGYAPCEIKIVKRNSRITTIRGSTPPETFRRAKKTLVVSVRRTLNFATCRPSAHYQLPLATSCPGRCEYCYLATTLGPNPYVRLYVNVEEILDRAAHYIDQRRPEITVFEASATSDPVPLEPFSGILSRAILFFADQAQGRLRVATKFTTIDSLLALRHNGHTRIRFSINAPDVIARYEHATPPLSARLRAASRLAAAGYPIGFIIAPIFAGEGWQEAYQHLLLTVKQELKAILASYNCDLTFELITHRFTTRAKKQILNVYPHTSLPLREEERKYKYGQFGYGKYVYPPPVMAEVRDFFEQHIALLFPGARVEYLV